MHLMDADKTYREKTCQELNKNATNYIEQILEVIPHETTTVRPFTSLYLKLSKSDEQDKRDTVGEAKTNS